MIASRSLSARAGLTIVTLLLISAFGLRLWNLNQPSIWHDEGWSIRAIRDPIHTPDDNTPPIYYGLMHLLWLGAGETPLALRYGSVLLDLLTLALAVRIARRWADWDAAILTAVLLGTSPLLWAYAREIRAYIAVPLLALAALTLADRLLEPRSQFPWRIGASLLGVELIVLYTHNLSVTLVGWLNLVVGGVWLWQRKWKFLVTWLAGQAALLLAYLPWVLGQSPSGTPLNNPPQVKVSLIWDIWQSYFAPLPTMIGKENALVIASAILGAAALVCVGAILTWNYNRRTLLVLSQALLLPALATVELLAAHIDFHPRYYIAGVPATMILIALGANSLPAPFEIRRLAVPAGMALAAGVAAASLPALFDKPRYQHDDFHAVAQHYASLPADTIILIPYGWEPALEEYYAKKFDIKADILGIKLHSSAETATQAINAALAHHQGPVRVELLTWYQLPADLRGMYSCLLESAAQRLDAPFTVQGITTQGYELSGPVQLTPFTTQQADYEVLGLSQALYGGTRSICVQTTWKLQRSTASDWRVSGRLLTLDPPGWIIAHSDTDIRQDDQAPTSQWKTGSQGAAFSLLRFPAGAPPTDYAVQFHIYSAQQPDGLDQRVNGVPAGKAITLGTVRASETTLTGFSPAPKYPVSIPISSGQETIELVGHNAQGGTLTPGQELRLTLYWHRPGDCCGPLAWAGAVIALRGDGWELVQPVAAYASYSQDWHAFAVPADASGTAALILEHAGPEPVTLATYTIEKTDHLFAPPAFDVPVQTEFVGVAVLEGFSVKQTTITTSETLGLTLVWKATATPAASYRVFTHLLDAQGRVIAQQDDYPVGGTRPTTGWVKGEYIVDSYVLTFNPEGKSYRGAARLEVGFYNPENNFRVPITGGGDHIVLPIEITVQ